LLGITAVDANRAARPGGSEEVTNEVSVTLGLPVGRSILEVDHYLVGVSVKGFLIAVGAINGAK
jgi:hypothetical protein